MTRPSVSALNVARSRAVAAHDPRDEIRGADHLAEVFLGAAASSSLADPATVTLLISKMDAVSPGGYAFFLARTAWLDAAFADALASGTPQVLILGAGYDTRALRFDLGASRVFEVDLPATQEHKRGLLDAAGVAAPPGLVHVPFDLRTDGLGEALAGAGYDPSARTLVLWEGVSYYLPASAVDETLAFVRAQTAAGSRVCFDVMLPADELAGRYGADQSRAAMAAMYADEPLRFALAPDTLPGWLARRGFGLVEALDADAMRARHLTLGDGTSLPALDLFRLVTAASA